MTKKDLIVGIAAIVSVFITGLGIFLIRVALGDAQQLPPDFSSSYKAAPEKAARFDVISYTIVVANTGGAATNVSLSDTLPSGVSLADCSYVQQGSLSLRYLCGSSPLWTADFAPGERITTTIAATVTAGTVRFPVENCAYLQWDDGQQKEMCVTTTANPVSPPTPTEWHLPLTMNGWAPPAPPVTYPYPLCPGEDIDREGTREEGGNDIQDESAPAGYMPVPYECIGWIHFAKPWGSDGPSSDIDYFYYQISGSDVGRAVRVTLTELPRDYQLIYYYPDRSEWGGSTNPGLQDEEVVLRATSAGVYTIKVTSQVLGHDPPVPEYDPDNYYLLQVDWR